MRPGSAFRLRTEAKAGVPLPRCPGDAIISRIVNGESMEPLRIGVVPYLNAYPLVRGLEAAFPEAAVTSAAPAVLGEELGRGDIDIAIASSIFACRDGRLQRVGRSCIASRGAVRSVQLFRQCPLDRVRRVGLHSASGSSVLLGRIILERHLGLAPTYVPFPEGGEFPSPDLDAVVMIGDRTFALLRRGVPAVDLGEAWRAYTALPFVYALWTGRGERDWTGTARRLEILLQRNLDDLAAVCEEAAARWSLSTEFCREYLTRNVHYGFGPEEAAGLRRFAEEAEGFTSDR